MVMAAACAAVIPTRRKGYGYHVTGEAVRPHGARLKVNVRPTIRRSRFNGFAVDIGRDGHGPFFDVTLGEDAERELEVLDIQPGQRHLLLLVRQPNGRREEKHKFLCGHDERDWFAAAVPETSGVATVRTAMEALKPP